jgi:hypothetical protein
VAGFELSAWKNGAKTAEKQKEVGAKIAFQ